MRKRLFLTSTIALISCLAITLSCGSNGTTSEEDSADSNGSSSSGSGSTTPISTTSDSASLVQTADLQYRGAIRLPGGDTPPMTFAYGGNAMTFDPDGDPGGGGDGFPGSLFITGHDRLAYGELPDGSRVAEVSIPAPVVSKDPSALNQGRLLQDFHDVTAGLFPGLDEIPRIGMAYLSTPATGAWIHLTWGQHLEEGGAPTHACFRTNLSSPDTHGAWNVGDDATYTSNGYLFDIPESWANAHASGRRIATGRYRDGGWSGQGPSLLAYVPWTDASGTLAAPGARLPATTLLRYVSSSETDNVRDRSLRDYQHPDEWEGGAWLTTTSGKSAVLFAGTKGVGAKFWYGWVNPAGADRPCVETSMVSEFTTCYLASGEPCPAGDLTGCSGHNDYRGWWSSRFEARFLLYDPGVLAQVASGAASPDAPQPYATLGIDDHLILPSEPSDADMLGRGAQRRMRISAATFDRANGFLYVLELYADGAKPVIHVWQVR